MKIIKFALQSFLSVTMLLTTLVQFDNIGLASEKLPEGICKVKGPMSEDDLHKFVACISNTLRDIVWPENILPAVKVAPVKTLRYISVELSFPNDCSLIPSFEPGSNRLNFPYPLHYYSLYNQQAVLTYLMGMPFVKTPKMLHQFLESKLKPHLVSLRKTCPGSSVQDTGKLNKLPPSILSKKISKQDQKALVEMAKNRMLVRKLEAYTGFSTVFFTLIHEYAHAVLHDNQRKNSLAVEIEADDYAASVFETSELPIAISLGLFDLLHGSSGSPHTLDLACRIKRLAKNHPTPQSFEQEFNKQIYDRLEDLRQYYVVYYSSKCNV